MNRHAFETALDRWITTPAEGDDQISICDGCHNNLYSNDEIIIFNGGHYCSYDCLRSEIGTYDIDLEEDTECSCCGERLYAGEEVIKSIDGSIFCDKVCVFTGYDIEEVFGYDLPCDN